MVSLEKKKTLSAFIDAFVSLNYDDSVQLVVQGATVKPEDGILFESIIKKYNQYSNIKFIPCQSDRERLGYSLNECRCSIIALWGLNDIGITGQLCYFTAIGFHKPVLISPEINPEVLEQYSIGEFFKFR